MKKIDQKNNRSNDYISKVIQSNAGFTLIETLVAITILLLSITGPLQIASNALLSSYYARDQITAYYLAAEAIEYIKNARDTQFLKDVFSPSVPPNNYWLKDLGYCINGGEGSLPDFEGCYIDSLLPFESGTAVSSCDVSCPNIKYDSVSGLWGYSNTLLPDSKFKRVVEIIPQAGDLEAVIKVKISWPSLSFFGGDITFELSGLITNWERL